MKSYVYTRDLDGAPIGTVRELSADDAAALIKSGAIVEATQPASDDQNDPLTDGKEKPLEDKGSVILETKPARAKPAKA